MTKLLLSALACFAFVATTSSVFADAEPNSSTGSGQLETPRVEGDSSSSEKK